jgi:hypothetical protein
MPDQTTHTADATPETVDAVRRFIDEHGEDVTLSQIGDELDLDTPEVTDALDKIYN